MTLVEAKNRMVVSRDWGKGKGREANQRVENHSYARWVSSRNRPYDTVSIYSNTALHMHTSVERVDLMGNVHNIILRPYVI